MSRSTTRKPVRKRKQECVECKFFSGNRKTCDFGKCNKGLDTTCYRQSKAKCKSYKFTSDTKNVDKEIEEYMFECLSSFDIDDICVDLRYTDYEGKTYGKTGKILDKIKKEKPSYEKYFFLHLAKILANELEEVKLTPLDEIITNDSDVCEMIIKVIENDETLKKEEILNFIHELFVNYCNFTREELKEMTPQGKLEKLKNKFLQHIYDELDKMDDNIYYVNVLNFSINTVYGFKDSDEMCELLQVNKDDFTKLFSEKFNEIIGEESTISKKFYDNHPKYKGKSSREVFASFDEKWMDGDYYTSITNLIESMRIEELVNYCFGVLGDIDE